MLERTDMWYQNFPLVWRMKKLDMQKMPNNVYMQYQNFSFLWRMKKLDEQERRKNAPLERD
jgi:hypothetical protein